MMYEDDEREGEASRMEALIRAGFSRHGEALSQAIPPGSIRRALRRRAIHRTVRSVGMVAVVVALGLLVVSTLVSRIGIPVPSPIAVRDTPVEVADSQAVVVNQAASVPDACHCVPIPVRASHAAIHEAINDFVKEVGMERGVLSKWRSYGQSRAPVNFSMVGHTSLDAKTIERCAAVLLDNYDMANVEVLDGRVYGLSLTRMAH